jgi:hypothetical protein
MRLISESVKARRVDLSRDLSTGTRTAGFTAPKPRRTASPKQTRPINFFPSQSDENITQGLSDSKFDSRQSRKKSL